MGTMIRIGCVSFLNAQPLINAPGNRGGPTGLEVRYDVPSRLLADLEAGEVDLALCPVIDYQRSAESLVIVPVGGIGCDGPTMTVRLFSREPLDRITRIAADTDSHTSVALATIIMRERFGNDVTIDAYDARSDASLPGAVLLIGDKVVTAAPPAEAYPHTLDLGEAWRELTGLPFVFAVWMAKEGTALGDAPSRLAAQRQANASRIDAIAVAHAPARDWPIDLAREYLGRLLRYEIGPRELEAMQLFWHKAHEAGLIAAERPLRACAPA